MITDRSYETAVLRDRAEGIARDIGGMEPLEGDAPYDVSYDLYVEELDGTLFGVIDMGDLYHEVFTWQDGEWDMAPAPAGQLATTYAFVIEDRILAARRGSGY